MPKKDTPKQMKKQDDKDPNESSAAKGFMSLSEMALELDALSQSSGAPIDPSKLAAADRKAKARLNAIEEKSDEKLTLGKQKAFQMSGLMDALNDVLPEEVKINTYGNFLRMLRSDIPKMLKGASEEARAFMAEMFEYIEKNNLEGLRTQKFLNGLEVYQPIVSEMFTAMIDTKSKEIVDFFLDTASVLSAWYGPNGLKYACTILERLYSPTHNGGSVYVFLRDRLFKPTGGEILHIDWKYIFKRDYRLSKDYERNLRGFSFSDDYERERPSLSFIKDFGQGMYKRGSYGMERMFQALFSEFIKDPYASGGPMERSDYYEESCACIDIVEKLKQIVLTVIEETEQDEETAEHMKTMALFTPEFDLSTGENLRFFMHNDLGSSGYLISNETRERRIDARFQVILYAMNSPLFLVGVSPLMLEYLQKNARKEIGLFIRRGKPLKYTEKYYIPIFDYANRIASHVDEGNSWFPSEFEERIELFKWNPRQEM